MDTFSINVPTKQIRKFYTLNLNSTLRHGPLARHVTAANGICKFLDIFGKKSGLWTFSRFYNYALTLVLLLLFFT
jgi:hypothetical protein